MSGSSNPKNNGKVDGIKNEWQPLQAPWNSAGNQDNMLEALDKTSGGLGTIHGRVTDHSSTLLSGATVKLQDSSAQEITMRRLTRGNGQYEVIYLTLGRYTVEKWTCPDTLCMPDLSSPM